MTKEDFLRSFTTIAKIGLINSILGEIYDKVQENINDPARIIKSHLDGVVEEASHDSRLVDIFINDYLLNMNGILKEVKATKAIGELIKAMSNIEPHTEI